MFVFLMMIKIGLWIDGQDMVVNVLDEDHGDQGLSSSSAKKLIG